MKALAFIVSFLLSVVPFVGSSGLFHPADPATSESGQEAPRDVPTLVRPGESILVDNASLPDGGDGTVTDPQPDSPPASPPANDTPPSAKKPFVAPKPAAPPDPFTAKFDPGKLAVPAGASVPATLVVANQHSWPLTITISTKSVTPGWRAVVGDDRTDIDPGESARVPVTLEAPLNANPGAVGRLVLLLSTPFPPSVREFTLLGDVPVPEVVRGVSIVANDGSKYVAPGETVDYGFTVTNLGSVSDTFRFDTVDGASRWSAVLSDASTTLGPGETKTLMLAVTAPTDAHDQDASWFNVTAQSTGDRTMTARAASFTVVSGPNDGLSILQVVCVPVPTLGDPATGPGAGQRICVDPRTLVPVSPDELPAPPA